MKYEKEEPKKLQKAVKKAKKVKKAGKVGKVLKEFAEKKLRSGSKKGPVVKNKKQALAIALNEAREAGEKIPEKKK